MSSIDSEKTQDRLGILLELLNLGEVKQGLEESVEPISSLSDLSQNTDAALQILEAAFAKVAECCNHWTVNSLLGSGPIVSYSEKVIYRVSKKLDRSLLTSPDSLDEKEAKEFTYSFIAEITLSVGLNYLSLLLSVNPILTGLGIISAALGETLIQSTMNTLTTHSFVIFTNLVRQRLSEYPDFKDFFPEYRLYTNLFREYNYEMTYDLEIAEFPDHLKTFKLIHAFSGVTNRGNLLYRLVVVLKKDKVFQARFEKKFCYFGKILWKLTLILVDLSDERTNYMR